MNKAIALALFVLCGEAIGQAQVPGRYFPLDHRQVPGVASRWNALTRPGAFGQPQPVQIHLPEKGTVSFYHGSPQRVVETQAPSQVGLFVGYTYRIKLSGLESHPGVELYPTLEVIDRLHPPKGLAERFPIPVEITAEELEAALQDRMITKVIYLEQPDVARPVESTGFLPVEELSPRENLMAAADHRGRPVAIFRLGGRIPDPQAPADEFYSQSPIQFSTATVPAE